MYSSTGSATPVCQVFGLHLAVLKNILIGNNEKLVQHGFLMFDVSYDHAVKDTAFRGQSDMSAYPSFAYAYPYYYYYATSDIQPDILYLYGANSESRPYSRPFGNQHTVNGNEIIPLSMAK